MELVDQVVVVSSPQVAELAKLLENTRVVLGTENHAQVHLTRVDHFSARGRGQA